MPISVVTDLDGTALTSAGQVPPSFRLLAYETRRDGGIVIAATARPPQSTDDLVGAIVDFAICLDGGLVMSTTRRTGRVSTIYEVTFDYRHAKAQVDRLLSEGKGALVFTGSLYDYEVLAVDPSRIRALGLYEEYLADGRKVTYCSPTDDVLDARLRSCRSITTLEMEGTAPASVYEARAVNGARCEVYPETRFYLGIPAHADLLWADYLPVRLSKGDAIQHLLEHTVLKRPFMALGNGHNDKSMLELADWAVGPRDVAPGIEDVLHYHLDSASGEKFLSAVRVLRLTVQ